MCLIAKKFLLIVCYHLLKKDFPELKIVFEHITTQDAADFVSSGDNFIARHHYTAASFI